MNSCTICTKNTHYEGSDKLQYKQMVFRTFCKSKLISRMFCLIQLNWVVSSTASYGTPSLTTATLHMHSSVHVSNRCACESALDAGLQLLCSPSAGISELKKSKQKSRVVVVFSIVLLHQKETLFETALLPVPLQLEHWSFLPDCSEVQKSVRLLGFAAGNLHNFLKGLFNGVINLFKMFS